MSIKTTIAKYGLGKMIDQLYEGVKKFQITEIRERRHLETCFENMRTSRYARSDENEYVLYYIMK